MININNCMLRTFPLAIALISALSFASQGDSNCSDILKSRLFNTSEYQNVQSVRERSKDDFCNHEYNNEQEVKEAANSAGLSGSYGVASGDYKQSQTTKSGKISVKDSLFCKSTLNELDNASLTRSIQTDTNASITAWSACIDKTNENILYYLISPNEDGTGFTGFIYRKLSTPGDFGNFQSIKTQPAADLKCTLGNEDINVVNGSNIKKMKGILSSKTSFSCTKDQNQHLKLVINTSAGTPDWIDMPSKAQIDELNINNKKLLKEKEKFVRHDFTVPPLTICGGNDATYKCPADTATKKWSARQMKDFPLPKNCEVDGVDFNFVNDISGIRYSIDFAPDDVTFNTLANIPLAANTLRVYISNNANHLITTQPVKAIAHLVCKK